MTIATIIGIVSALIALARLIFRWVSASAERAALKQEREADNAVLRAKTARDSVRIAGQRDPTSILRDDGFKRPGD